VAQKWRLENNCLRSVYPGICLDIRAGYYFGNHDAIAYACDGSKSNQRFFPGRDMIARGGERTIVTGGGMTAVGGLISPFISVTNNGALVGGTGNASGVIAAGGANVIAAGGANVIAAGGANVIAAGGANVIAAGGAN
jgi:hypothetical protein